LNFPNGNSKQENLHHAGLMYLACYGFVLVAKVWQQNMNHFVTVQEVIQNGRWNDSTLPTRKAWFRYYFLEELVALSADEAKYSKKTGIFHVPYKEQLERHDIEFSTKKTF